MITREELTFARKFVAAMSCLNISRIPFGNESFQLGMDEFSKAFARMEGEIKNNKKISLLFIRKPITGTYDRMMEALQYLNGYDVSFSFQNPRLETTDIKVAVGRARLLLDSDDCGVPKEFFLDGARAFCEAANVVH